MKKIIFMLINMNIGGTEKSLLNILNELPSIEYDITLLLLEESGGFLNSIPSHVKVKCLNDYKDIKDIKDILNKPPKSVAKENMLKGYLIKGFNIMFYHALSKILDDRGIYFKYVLKKYSKLKDRYDIAVAFAGPMDFISYYVLNKINAQKKFQWIHFDVTKVAFSRGFTRRNYTKFDKVFVVSKEGKEKLDTLIPSIQNKTEVLHNIISPNIIRKMASEGRGFDDDFEGTRILTVGRLSKEKGQYLTIPVLARLKSEGYNVRWYCVGQGNLQQYYGGLVEQYNVKDDYIFLGSDSNPYTKMQDCDIYVQPSIHEGFCITLAEARCFSSPIITTNFTGAREQIIHGKNGLISETKEEDLYINIKKILDDNDLRNEIIKNLKVDEPNTMKEIKKLKIEIEK